MIELNSKRARIFRIVHAANIPWILDHGGLHCQSASEQDSDYVNIGNTGLISRRAGRFVPIPLGGTLSNYVPFYSLRVQCPGACSDTGFPSRRGQRAKQYPRSLLRRNLFHPVLNYDV